MAGSIALPMSAPARARAETAAAAASIPWYVWCSIVAITSAMIGVHWDISWHRSIGRDTFWTPAHIAIYMCGVLAGISCGYLILSTTFGGSPAARDNSVRMWGFRGPLGAFICAWGGVAMITSAPFDNWWHDAYGLDVKILSPPHVLLAVGMISIEFGAMLLVLGHLNRAQGRLRERLTQLFFYAAAMTVVALLVLFLAFTFRTEMHTALFYRVIMWSVPPVLAAVSRASGRRWACTTVMAIYTAFLLGMNWILPLFPAQPKLGPVFQNVTHFVPPGFPLLLIVPALVLDWIWLKTARRNDWVQAAIGGVSFLAVFIAVQWPFADFLLTPASRNWFFGTQYVDYATPSTSSLVRNVFIHFEKTPAEFATAMAFALFGGILMIRIGLALGNWMKGMQR